MVSSVWLLIPQTKATLTYATLSFVGLVNAIKGYGYGVKGWELRGGMSAIKDDLVNHQLKSTATSLLSLPSNLQATIYLAATITTVRMQVMALVDIVKHVRSGAQVTTLAPHLMRYTTFAILAGVSFVLKDAADRGRLEGSTFVQLNFLEAIVFGTLAAHLNGLAGSFSALAKAMAAFSFMTVLNGCVGLIFKIFKVRYHDKTLKSPLSARLSDEFPLEE